MVGWESIRILILSCSRTLIINSFASEMLYTSYIVTHIQKSYQSKIIVMYLHAHATPELTQSPFHSSLPFLAI